MTVFKIRIDSEDAAMQDNPRAEVARMLADVRNKIMRGDDCGIIYDVNGNSVGDFEFEDEPDDPPEVINEEEQLARGTYSQYEGDGEHLGPEPED
jgi:hypothetical protein